jgi:hypothetical protein
MVTAKEAWWLVKCRPRHKPLVSTLNCLTKVKEGNHFPAAGRWIYLARGGWGWEQEGGFLTPARESGSDKSHTRGHYGSPFPPPFSIDASAR